MALQYHPSKGNPKHKDSHFRKINDAYLFLNSVFISYHFFHISFHFFFSYFFIIFFKKSKI